MTAEVLLTGTNGLTLTARAFLDGGSNLSIVSHITRRTLALKPTGNSVSIDGVGGVATGEPSPLVRVTISSNYRKGWKKHLTAAVMVKPTRDIPILSASDTKSLPHLQGLVLADQNYDQPRAIDILLGQDIWDDLFLSGRIKGPQGTPSAWHTVFGWVVTGLYKPDSPNNAICASAHYTASVKANKVSDDLLGKSFVLEEPPKHKKVFTAEEQLEEKHFEQSHKFIKSERRNQVTLPRTLGEKQLGESRSQALHRVKPNENSSIRKGRYSAFQNVMSEYIELGQAKPVSHQDLPLPSSSTYYMPAPTIQPSLDFAGAATTKAWGYVPTEENPADCASRRITATELANHPLWWQGHPWLLKQPVCTPPSPSAARVKKDDDHFQEEQSEPLLVSSAIILNHDSRLEDSSKSDSTLVKLTCWGRRIIDRGKRKKIVSEKKLSVEEALATEEFLIKKSQTRTFSTEGMLLSVDKVPEGCQLPQEDLPTKDIMKQGFMAREDVMSTLPPT